MGFFDGDAATETAAGPATDISGPVPHDDAATEFFAESNTEEPLPSEEPIQSTDTTLPPAQDAEVGGPTDAGSNVPISELLLERKKRQDMEQQLTDQQHNLLLLNERIQHAQQLQDMDRQRQNQAVERQRVEESMPDPEEAPLEHANWKVDRLEKQLRQMAGSLVQQRRQDAAIRQETQAQGAVQGVVQQSQNLQNQFAQQTPDYWEALDFLTETRSSELSAMGYSGPELSQILDNERGLIVTSAIERNTNGQMTGWKHNPAEAAYNLARMRGYKTANEAQEELAQHAANTQQAPAEPVEVSPRDRMEMVNNGMAASSRVASMGATTNTGSINIEQLIDMTDAEFSRFSEANPGVVEALLGS